MPASATAVREAVGRELLGPAAISDDDLAALVRGSLRRPGLQLENWWVEPVDYAVRTPSTGLLARIKGEASDDHGTVAWSNVRQALTVLATLARP